MSNCESSLPTPIQREQIEQWMEGARDPNGHPGWYPATNRDIYDLCEMALRTFTPSESTRLEKRSDYQPIHNPALVGPKDFIVSGSFLLDLEHAFLHIEEVCRSTKGPDFTVITTMLKRIRDVAIMGKTSAPSAGERTFTLPPEHAICERRAHGERSIGWIPVGREQQDALLRSLLSATGAIYAECEALARKKSVFEPAEDPDDNEYWRGYAKGREDAAEEIRMHAPADSGNLLR